MAGAADPALKAALIEMRAKLVGAQALIEHLQLQREKFGPRSERSQRLIDQLELQLEELAAAAGEDEAKAEAAGVQGARLQAAAGDAAKLSRRSAASAHCSSGADMRRRARLGNVVIRRNS